MLIVQRLYLKDFFTLLFLIALGLSGVFSLLDVVTRIDEFPSSGPLILYALYTMPKFFIYLLPMSVLVCSLFTFSQAFRRKEIMAIKSAGGRLKTAVFIPFVLSGILLSLLAFITSEFIVPDLSKKAIELRTSPEKKGKNLSFNNGRLWLKSKDGSPVRIDLFIAEKNMAQGIDIFSLGNEFLKERIIAEKAFWNGEAWILENITKYDIVSGRIEKLASMRYTGLESPDLFAEEIKKPEDMGISELYRYIQRLQSAGFSNIKLIVDLHAKISFPLINTFMMLLGISLSSTSKLGSGLISAGLGLVISMIYWFGYTFMLSLGYAGIIPPFIAAWIIPGCFGTCAVWLFLKMPE